jgi:hypothetical protein
MHSSELLQGIENNYYKTWLKILLRALDDAPDLPND